ncbi:unnamed protein product [Amoebophrya sp. A25]|nr:unnamed protein product [Amoebophrya sp. A25]|eukprot:GSA25T00000349001.1
MSATCDTFVMPCKHLCLCSDCAMTLQLRMLTTQNGQTAVRCPLCRGDITNCIKLNGRSRSGSGVQLPEQQQRGNQAIPNHSASGSGTTTAAPLSDGTSSGIRAENLQTAERILNEPEPANGGSTWLPWVGRENYRDGDVAHNNPIVRRRVENLIVDARGGQQATGTSGERNSQQQGGGRTPVARISGEQQNQMEMTQIVSEGTGTQQAPETSTNAPAASPNRLAATANVVASRTNTGSASGSSSSPSRRASREENQGGNQGGFASLNFAEDIANAFRSMRIRGAEEQSAIPARTVKRIKAEWRSLDAAKERLRKEGFAFARISSFSHTTSINPVMPITSSATAASSSSSSSSAPPDTSPAPGGPSTTEGDMRFLQVSILTSGVPEDSHLGREMRRSGVAQLDFEVMFTDHFPMEAPKLRLVRPTVSMGSFWVQKQGALCMELLSADGWSPALSVEQMAFSVRAMMMNCNSGTVYPNTTYDDRQAAHEESKNIDKSHAGNYANMAS